jgi:hypothetical protein
MNVSTNLSKPKKKKSPVAEAFKKAEEQAAKKYTADSESAKKYDQSLKEKSKGFTVKTGKYGQKDLAASRSYGSVASGAADNEKARVKGLKETGYYDAKPAVVGGTKKLLKKSKKNVAKSSASKQAKASAKKLY